MRTYLQESEPVGVVLRQHLRLGVAEHGDEALGAEDGVAAGAAASAVQGEEAPV